MHTHIYTRIDICVRTSLIYNILVHTHNNRRVDTHTHTHIHTHTHTHTCTVPRQKLSSQNDPDQNGHEQRGRREGGARMEQQHVPRRSSVAAASPSSCMSRCPGLARDIQAAAARQAAAQAAGSAGFRVPRALSSEASDGIRRSSRGGAGGAPPAPLQLPQDGMERRPYRARSSEQ